MNSFNQKDFYQSKIDFLISKEYEELSPLEYYRLMFPEGSFQKPNESNGDYKPNGIIQYRCKDEEKNTMHIHVINDDLQSIKDCVENKGRYKDHDFVIISGCAYIGRQKTNKNVRMCHAIIIDIDAVDKSKLSCILGMGDAGLVPIPTAIVVSGNGVHVVYMLDKPIPTYSTKATILANLKAMLTRKLWNANTSFDPNVQYQGIVQGYRAVGTLTKKGHLTRAFLTGKKVKIEDLIDAIKEIDVVPFLKPNKKLPNGTVSHKLYSQRLKECMSQKDFSEKMLEELGYYDFHTPLSEAKSLWPDWYNRIIVQKQKPRHYKAGVGLYNWWLGKINSKENVHIGNRRNCLYCLAAFAQKCDVDESVFLNDINSLLPLYESMAVNNETKFTQGDVNSVLDSYRNTDLTRMTKKRMQMITGIKFPEKDSSKERKKRNEHLKECRDIRDANYTDGTHWYDGGGRPSKEEIVKQYISSHPEVKSISKIAKECGVSRPTVYKYLN